MVAAMIPTDKAIQDALDAIFAPPPPLPPLELADADIQRGFDLLIEAGPESD